MNSKVVTLSLVTCLVCAMSTIASANLVQNPGFETGALDDWTANTAAPNFWRVQTAGFNGLAPFAGSFFATTGCSGAPCITGTSSEQSSLSQTLSTTAGQSYNLTFEFYTGAFGAPNELDVLWNGTSVLDLGPGGTLGDVTVYTLYSVPNLIATSSSTTLTFLGRQDPGWDALDNVDVEAASATPEPSSLALLVSGALGLLGVSRRKLL